MIGTLYLALATNALATGLGILTSLTYLGAYTPLKRKTTLATAVGAFPGAVPPLIGWAAAQGNAYAECVDTFRDFVPVAVPCTLAGCHRLGLPRGLHARRNQDAAHCGSGREAHVSGNFVYGGTANSRQSVARRNGPGGTALLFGALVLGIMLVEVCLWAAASKTNIRAKWLMHATVLHLPLLLGLLIYDKFTR